MSQGEVRRIHGGRGNSSDVAEARLRVETHRRPRRDPNRFLKKIRQTVRHNGKDELHVRMVEATNSETFKEFMEDIRKSHPKSCMVLDNASYHHSHTVNEYVEGTGGDIEMEFLPPYTLQLNQIENVWRDLKKRLAGRYFKSIEELKTAITVILEKEMNRRLKGYLVE